MTNQNPSILDKIKTILSLILLLIFAVVFIYNIYSGFTLKKFGIPGFEVEFGEKAVPSGLNEWYGFFGDWDETKNTYVTREKIKLNFEKENRVAGLANGIVIENGKEVSKAWEFKGFYTSDYLVLSYITQETIPMGIGSYFLQRSGDGYVGALIQRDCKNKAILKCPYALSKTDMNIDAAKKNWPTLLGQNCVELKLDPQVESPECVR